MTRSRGRASVSNVAPRNMGSVSAGFMYLKVCWGLSLCRVHVPEGKLGSVSAGFMYLKVNWGQSVQGSCT